MEVISPVTLKTNTILKDSLTAEKIIGLYKEDFDVDVSDTFSGIDNISIYECQDTGFLFYHPVKLSGSEDFYNDLKKQMPIKYQTSYYSDDKWEYGISMKFIRETDKVYEIGAGNGSFLAKLKLKGLTQLHGSELNKDSIAAASTKGITLEYKTIEEKSKDAEYDIVCTFQVLEHVENVHSFIDSALQLLKPDGKLIIAVPYNNPYLFKNDLFNTLNLPPHHMGLWNQKAFRNLPNFFPMDLEHLIVEKLPSSGYDFTRYYEINKDINYSKGKIFKNLYDKLYWRWLKKNHKKIDGKNIVAIFKKL